MPAQISRYPELHIVSSGPVSAMSHSGALRVRSPTASRDTLRPPLGYRAVELWRLFVGLSLMLTTAFVAQRLHARGGSNGGLGLTGQPNRRPVLSQVRSKPKDFAVYHTFNGPLKGAKVELPNLPIT
jgi:hypothetical protein